MKVKVKVKFKEQNFFATISNVDIKSLSKSEFIKIKEAVESYGVVVIESQNIDDEDQIKLTDYRHRCAILRIDH